MSEYFRISPGGQLTLYKHNGERQGKYRYCKVDGKPALKDRETKEVVQVFETEEDQLNFFYDSNENVEYTWTGLRNSVYLDEGVTLGDILKVIEDHAELETLAEAIAPLYPAIRGHVAIDEPADLMIVTAQGIVRKGVFHFEYELGFQNGRNWDHTTVVEISNSFPIYENGEFVADLIYEPTLFDLLVALFGGDDGEPCELTKEGLGLEGDAIDYLLRPIKVAEDVTLGDVFNFVENNPMLKQFISAYSWCRPIDEFHQQAKKPVPADKEDSKLWHLELTRHCTIYNKDSWFHCDADFHGIGELSEDEKEWKKEHPERERPDYTTYGVSMTHMAVLASLPFVLDEKFELTWVTKSYKVKQKRVIQMGYTLMDFLDAIYWDISFYGGPEDAESIRETLSSQIKEIKEALDRGEDAGLTTLDLQALEEELKELDGED